MLSLMTFNINAFSKLLKYNLIYILYNKNILEKSVARKQVFIKSSSSFGGNHLKIMTSLKTIEDFGYCFNKEGKLRKIKENGEASAEPFQFNVSDNHQECQKHYEELGEAITDYVYQLLENQEKLVRLPVPQGSTSENGSFIFVSKDYDKKHKLIILIHGSGVVRAGQWARSLIINDSIDKGTQIPYIRTAIDKNYGVVVMNTNDNFRSDCSKILQSGNPEEHAAYVWNNYILNTSASSIAIVAHSYGGLVTLYLSDKFKNDFENRVKVVAFTDSVHGFSNLKVTKFLKQISKNWVSSNEPLDTPIKTPDLDIIRVSAGHAKHEMTSYSCMDSVFKFIDEKISIK